MQIIHNNLILRTCIWDQSQSLKTFNYMEHSGYGFSQWEVALVCDAFSHWPSPCPEWSPKLSQGWTGIVLKRAKPQRSTLLPSTVIAATAAEMLLLSLLLLVLLLLLIMMMMLMMVITWRRHQMETFSALLALCAGNSPVPVNSPHRGQWRGALMFSLICVWINDWVNNREVGYLRRYRAHYDFIVM